MSDNEDESKKSDEGKSKEKPDRFLTLPGEINVTPPK